MNTLKNSFLVLLIVLSPHFAFCESPDMGNAESILERTNSDLESLLWTADFEDLFNRFGADTNAVIEKTIDESTSIDEYSYITNEYLYNIDKKTVLTRVKSREIMYMVNIKLALYCMFSDVLWAVDKEENLKQGLQFVNLSRPGFLIEDNLLKKYDRNSPELVYAKWLNKAIEENLDIRQMIDKKEENRSVSSILIDGNIESSIAKNAADRMKSMLGSHEINYEWKMAILKWSELLKDWEKSHKYLVKLNDIFSMNNGSDKKAVADLKKYLTFSKEWILAKDRYSRYILFDSPLIIHSDWAYYICNVATGGMFDDEDMVFNEGVEFSKISPFIVYITAEETKQQLSIVKTWFKKTLSTEQYNEMLGWSKVQPHWFEEPPLLISKR